MKVTVHVELSTVLEAIHAEIAAASDEDLAMLHNTQELIANFPRDEFIRQAATIYLDIIEAEQERRAHGK